MQGFNNYFEILAIIQDLGIECARANVIFGMIRLKGQLAKFNDEFDTINVELDIATQSLNSPSKVDEKRFKILFDATYCMRSEP